MYDAAVTDPTRFRRAAQLRWASPTMKNIARSFLLAAASVATLHAQQITGPSSSNSPYATITAPGWTATSIITTGDSALNGYRAGGIPDGLGVFDNGNGTFTLLSNHELFDTWGITRPDGAAGAYVSKLVINKSDFSVVSGSDFLTSSNNLYLYNRNTAAWASGTPYAMWRLCSADLAPVSAMYNNVSGKGYNGQIFMNGEEGAAASTANNVLGSRGFAWVATGSEAGKVYELPHLGRYAIENLLANPFTADKTVVAGNNDTSPYGQVFVYIGDKNTTGSTAIEKAGLTNGQLYGVKVTSATGYTGAVTAETATGLIGTFVLANTGNTAALTAAVGAAAGSAQANAITATGLQTAATTAGITQFLRPEDGAWLNATSYLFNTTGSKPTGAPAQYSAKVYRLDFTGVTVSGGIMTGGDFTTGGNISVLVDSANLRGKDGSTAWMFDNIGVGKDGLVYVNEDPGANGYIAKTWIIDPTLATQALREANATQVMEVDRNRFLGSANTTVTSGVSGTNTVTVASTTGLVVGQKVSATGIVDGTTITAINAATGVVTLSANLTATSSGRFYAGTDFRTIDEEFTGIIDISDVMGVNGTTEKWVLVAIQNHAVVPAATDTFGLVEGGQYVAMHYTSNNVTLPGGGATLTMAGDTLASNNATITNAFVLNGTGGIFDMTGTNTISGSISGTGQLWKLGSGELILSANSTYAGNTNVSNGILTVDGNLASPSVNVYKGATLKGHGTINGSVSNYGTVAPGNSPGILTINGNYTENGVLDIEIGGTGGAGVNPNGHDKLVVLGTFTAAPATTSPAAPGATLRITKYNGFDPARGQAFQVIAASAFTGSFATLDRNSQTGQVFFQPSTGYVYGTGLTESQTFAAYESTLAGRQAIGAALYADGLVSGTIIANGAGSTTSTGKAYLASNDLGNAVAGVLLAADVGAALDALSPEPYGTSLIMASRNSLTLARALTTAVAAPEGWNIQVGYDQQQATITASPTTLNGRYDINSTYVIATKALGTGSQLSVLLSQNDGTTTAAGFSSKGSGQSLGLGFAADLGAARLDLALTSGEIKADGTRNGQAFANQKLSGSSMLARLSFSKLGAFVPYVGLNRTTSSFDAFTETGTGANLNVSGASQTNTNAEVGLAYEVKLTDMVSMSLNVGYEHNLESSGNSLTASFADAATPTSFNVATYGAGQNIVRGGVGFQANLGAGRTAGLSYDMHSGVDMKSAHEVKVNYTFRF